jgi:hypothetical protein
METCLKTLEANQEKLRGSDGGQSRRDWDCGGAL